MSNYHMDINNIVFYSYHTAGYDMTVSDYDKRTALHIAVKNNQEHVVEYLMKECGLTEEAKDRYTFRFEIHV